MIIILEETSQLDERMTTSENEETLQDSLNVSKQDDVSTETSPVTRENLLYLLYLNYLYQIFQRIVIFSFSNRFGEKNSNRRENP